MAGVETLAAIAVPAINALYKTWVKTVGDAAEQRASLAQAKLVELAKDYEQKRDIYLTREVDPDTIIEKRRVALLEKLTASQNRILFEISDPDLIARLVPFAIEQATGLYAAVKAPEFALIEMNIGQIEAMLRNSKSLRESRSRNRSMAIWFVGIVICGLVILFAAAPYVGFSTSSVIPLINIPLPVVIWSSIGSLGAMLWRFKSSADAELADPLRWSFIRPLTGVLMGIIAYMVFKVGAVVLQPGAASAAANLPISQELLWLAAFLAGFSDRFADSVLRSLTGRLGGDRIAELQSLDQSVGTSHTTLSALADRLGWGRHMPSLRGASGHSVSPAEPEHQPVSQLRNRVSKGARTSRGESPKPPAAAPQPVPASSEQRRGRANQRAVANRTQPTGQEDPRKPDPANQTPTKRAPRQRPKMAEPGAETQTLSQPSTVVSFPETAG
jgi:hypothetical protein